MEYSRISVSILVVVMAALDEAAATDRMTRSAYIREAVALKIELEATIEEEVLGKASMLAAVKQLHSKRIASRSLREMGPLTYRQAQE